MAKFEEIDQSLTRRYFVRCSKEGFILLIPYWAGREVLETSLGLKLHIDAGMEWARGSYLKSTSLPVISDLNFPGSNGSQIRSIEYRSPTGGTLTVDIETTRSGGHNFKFQLDNQLKEGVGFKVSEGSLGLKVPANVTPAFGIKALNRLGDMVQDYSGKVSPDLNQRGEALAYILESVSKDLANKGITQSPYNTTYGKVSDGLLHNWPGGNNIRGPSDVPRGFLLGDMNMPVPATSSSSTSSPSGSAGSTGSSSGSSSGSNPGSPFLAQGVKPSVKVGEYKDIVRFHSQLTTNAAAKNIVTGLKGNAVTGAVESFINGFAMYGEAYSAATTDVVRQAIVNQIVRNVGSDLLLNAVILPASPIVAGGGVALILNLFGVETATAVVVGTGVTIGLGALIISVPVYKLATDPQYRADMIGGFRLAAEDPWDYTKFYGRALWFTTRILHEQAAQPLNGEPIVATAQGPCLPCLFGQTSKKHGNMAQRVIEKLKDPRLKSLEEIAAAVALQEAFLDDPSFSDLAGNFSENPKNTSASSGSLGLPPVNPSEQVFYPGGFSSLLMQNNSGNRLSNITVTVLPDSPAVNSVSSVPYLPGQPKKSAGMTGGQWNVWVWPDGVESNLSQSYGVRTEINPAANSGYWRRTDGKDFMSNFAALSGANSAQQTTILGPGGPRLGSVSEAGRVELAVVTAPTIMVRPSGSQVINRSPNGTSLSSGTKSAISGNIAAGTGAVPVERPKPIHGIPLGQAIPRL